MRRYVECAARHFGLSGFVINTKAGDVLGVAWTSETNESLDNFEIWVRGKWEPREYHNLKPTPIGTAYPSKARVESAVVLRLYDTNENASKELFRENRMTRFRIFSMIREDRESEMLARDFAEVETRLKSDISLERVAWVDWSTE